jgi:sialate O-acetylesterase
MKINLSLFLVLFIIFSSVKAEITLPAVFGDNMVLQQKTDAAIWGKATSNKTVKVTTSWNKKNYTTKADSDGRWKVKVSTPDAGGPYSVTISDGNPVTLNNVLIGEVWVCSGQSNMQMIMNGYHNQPILGSNRAIATSTNNNIRLMTIEREKSLFAEDEFKGKWLECTPGNVGNFSATAYFFGKMLNETLEVPVGLICSAWGGTRIEPWISENGFKNFDWVELPDKNMQGEFSQQTPTVLYNAMIAPMVGYGIRGAIWYQGESNRNEPIEYEKLMSGLIDNWRSEWGIGDFSFFYCQIAPYEYGAGVNSAFLREAQLNASTATSNTGMACLMDVGEANNIHPANKEAAGERLAYLALAKTYGMQELEYSGPVLKEMTVEGSVVKLTFDHAKYGLTSFGKELKNFTVAGENRKQFFPATAFITRDGVTLFSPSVEKPVAVRYAFENYVVGELFNNEGLPASSFRTDDWEIE